MHSYPKDFEATITFRPTEDGGRKTPARTGYRPQFFYDGEDWDAVQTFPDHEWVYPGQTLVSHISFLNPEHHRGKLNPGKEFQLREGTRVIATGMVTKVLELATRLNRPLDAPNP